MSKTKSKKPNDFNDFNDDYSVGQDQSPKLGVTDRLINAIEAGDRMKSCDAYAEWLSIGDNPEMRLRQVIEACLYDLVQSRSVETIRKITDAALSSERLLAKK
jgi:hypothetical protein